MKIRTSGLEKYFGPKGYRVKWSACLWTYLAPSIDSSPCNPHNVFYEEAFGSSLGCSFCYVSGFLPFCSLWNYLIWIKCERIYEQVFTQMDFLSHLLWLSSWCVKCFLASIVTVLGFANGEGKWMNVCGIIMAYLNYLTHIKLI